MPPKNVCLIEVGPRDGLQNESVFIPTEKKVQFIDLLSQTGVKQIEVSSFVSPKFIPQLQDAEAVFTQIHRYKHIKYSALIPNIQGWEVALKHQPDSIAVFTAASETFNQHNIHCSIEESIQRFIPVITQAKQLHIPIRAYISCALGCPYEGEIRPSQVISVCETLLKLGVDEISVADTIGVGTPKQTRALLKALHPLFSHALFACHFHDTYGQALANILSALELGIERFDTSVAGLGGCPYAPGASGNVATEDVLYFMHGLGIETGIDIFKMIEAGRYICEVMKKQNQSKVAKAMLAHFNFKKSES